MAWSGVSGPCQALPFQTQNGTPDPPLIPAQNERDVHDSCWKPKSADFGAGVPVVLHDLPSQVIVQGPADASIQKSELAH